jgi:hypothetical protein
MTDALREAAQAVVLAAKKHTPEIVALNRALAAAIPQPALDVERLADAIFTTGVSVQDDETRQWITAGDAAARFAREYAAAPSEGVSPKAAGQEEEPR